VDALPPPQPPREPAAATYLAATDIRPRNEEERRLCAKASNPDWLYLGGLLALDVGSVLLHPQIKYNESQAVRTFGAGFIGLSWGATLGGGVLALPTCKPYWAPGAPPEGDVRRGWPLTLALATVAAGTSPLIVGIVTGSLPRNWSFEERSSRLWLAAGSGFAGALLPHIPFLSPKTTRAARELERLRVDPTVGGAQVTYTVRF
jgi:hypothetical protein